MGFISWLQGKFKKKPKESDPLIDSMEETLKAYKIRADMIEEHKSLSAWMDHYEEYKHRMETEPIPSWEHSEIIIARLELLRSMYPPKLPEFLKKFKERVDSDASSR